MADKPSKWPTPSEITNAAVKIVKDIKRSADEIIADYKDKRQAEAGEAAPAENEKTETTDESKPKDKPDTEQEKK